MIRRTGEQAIRRLANNDEWSLRRVTNEVKSLAAKTCTINWVNCRNMDNVKIHEPLGNSDHNQIHFDINVKSESKK